MVRVALYFAFPEYDHCSSKLMESTTYPALIQLEQKDAGLERFAQDGLFLYAWLGIGMIWFKSSKVSLTESPPCSFSQFPSGAYFSPIAISVTHSVHEA